MIITAIVKVRDEIELIDSFIRHHRKIGVDIFIIVDAASTDGTREKLIELSKEDDILLILEEAQSEDTNCLWSAPLIEIARNKFGADYVMYADMDEFWLSAQGNLKALLTAHPQSEALSLRRYNAAVERTHKIATSAIDEIDVDNQFVVAAPSSTGFEDWQSGRAFRWINVNVGPKVIVKSSILMQFTIGGHGALDEHGNNISTESPSDAIIVHFPVTSWSRFLNKTHNITDFAQLHGHRYPNLEIGWHWRRLIEIINESGEAGLRQEYFAHFIDESTFENDIESGRICKASKLISSRR